MSGGSLLDLMVQDNVEDQKKAVERRLEERQVATTLERERVQARQREQEAEWRELERRAAEQAASRPAEIAGLRVGMRFQMKNCGPEIDGIWVVARVDPGAAGDQSRRLWGQRANGGEGYLPLTERKALDALHYGILVRLD
ncbi:MAG: hypothetical protein KC549_04245 [Myxococcales bacterium]|nr:hypothetical protein [Myxococcales bacterium]MCB9547659.1 hypothetical protein [Myxococcales bacterium]